MRRKKRYIHAIPIEQEKPRHLPVKIQRTTTSTVHINSVSDAYDFQRLIEPQDDEVCHFKFSCCYFSWSISFPTYENQIIHVWKKKPEDVMKRKRVNISTLAQWTFMNEEVVGIVLK